MAIEYQLLISTSKKAPQIMELLYGYLDAAWNQDCLSLTREGVQITVAVCSRSQKALMEESFGFAPDVVVYFRLAKEIAERQEGYRVMLKMVVELLKQEAGQAVLLFNGEDVLLQRLAEGLVLNQGWRTWQQENSLELMTTPYTMQSIPSPLL